MIRLAVHGEQESWPAIASRLRDAAIVNVGQQTALSDYDAVLALDDECENAVLEQSLAKNKHLLVAAGAWTTQEQLASLTAVAQLAGVQLAVINPERFLPSRQLIRQQLEAGKLGEPGLIRIHRWESIATRRSLNTESLPSPLIWDVDIALWLAGESPNSVYATQVAGEIRSSDEGRTIQVHLRFASGAMALIDYSNQLPSGDGYRSLSIIGSTGAAYADDHQNVQLLYQGSQPRAVRVDERVRQLTNIMQTFVDDLHLRTNLASTVAIWQQVTTVVADIEESLRSHKALMREARS